nr:hypothetical protein B0A51_14029 [Rachicladosporium sp. CCFEE 5018]
MEAFKSLAGASKQPAITAESLIELDSRRLRRNANFDYESQFRPNRDGAKGKKEIKAAHWYGKALEPEDNLMDSAGRAPNETNEPKTVDYWKAIMCQSRKKLPAVRSGRRSHL